MNKPDIYYKGTRMDVVTFLPQHYSRVLEIGCGEGGFRNNLSDSCEYWGIEPVEDIAKTAMDKLDNVLIGKYEEVANMLPDKYFDLIICNDVIEHMVDHHFFYENIVKKMKINAYIVGAIPNVRYLPNLLDLLQKKDWEYKEEGILDRTHLRFFTETSIKRDFSKNNFIIEEFHGINGLKYTWKTKSGIIMNLIKLFLGKDTEFLQFGFRVRIL